MSWTPQTSKPRSVAPWHNIEFFFQLALKVTQVETEKSPGPLIFNIRYPA